MDSDKAEYEVERVMDRRIKESRVEYYIKWKGYSMEQATWEPINNLRRALKSILKFERTARQSAERRKQRRALLSNNLGRPKNASTNHHKQAVKKLSSSCGSFLDDVQTIIIDSDEEVQKFEMNEFVAELNLQLNNMDLQSQIANSRINLCVDGAVNGIPEQEVDEQKVDVVSDGPQKLEAQDGKMFLAKFKNGKVVTITKKELIEKYPTQFDKYNNKQEKNEL